MVFSVHKANTGVFSPATPLCGPPTTPLWTGFLRICRPKIIFFAHSCHAVRVKLVGRQKKFRAFFQITLVFEPLGRFISPTKMLASNKILWLWKCFPPSFSFSPLLHPVIWSLGNPPPNVTPHDPPPPNATPTPHVGRGVTSYRGVAPYPKLNYLAKTSQHLTFKNANWLVEEVVDMGGSGQPPPLPWSGQPVTSIRPGGLQRLHEWNISSLFWNISYPINIK